MSRHDGLHGQAVTVAELLEREAEAGNGLRLNWTDDPRGLALTTDDDWPTCVLPRIEVEAAEQSEDEPAVSALPEQRNGREEVAAQDASGLPARTPGALPPPMRPVAMQSDPELLRRILEGLRGLG